MTLACGLAGFSLAGCGNGATEVSLPGPTAPTAALPKKDFVDRANDVCRAAERAIATETEDHGPVQLGEPGSREASAELLARIEPIAEAALTRLRNLTPPPADAPLIDRGLQRMEDALAAARQDPSGRIDPIGLTDAELYRYGLSGCFANP